MRITSLVRTRTTALALPILCACLAGTGCRRLSDGGTGLDGDVPGLPTDGGVIRFETVKVSTTTSRLAQGETEVVAADDGRVAVVWMDGSPAAQTQMTLRAATSSDHGRSFAPDFQIDGKLRLGDPSLAVTRDGSLVLAALRKDSLLSYTDLAVILYRSSDFGRTWTGPTVINDDDVFNDRDWLRADPSGRLHLVHMVRTQAADETWQLPVYYRVTGTDAASFGPRVLVNPLDRRPAGTNGGIPIGVAPTGERVIVGLKAGTPTDRSGSPCGAGPMFAYALPAGDGKTFGPAMRVAPADKDMPAGCEGLMRADMGPYGRLEPVGKDAIVVWVGTAGAEHAVYAAMLRAGKDEFDPPVTLARGPAYGFGLPLVTADRTGAIHAFWMAVRSDKLWSPAYARSTDGGRTFSEVVAVTSLGFPAEQWAGDFNAAWTTTNDLYVSWAAAGGAVVGIYLSVARGAVR